MTQDPIDKNFGIPLGEWIERIPNELGMDAVGLWQIVRAGRYSFDLNDDALRDFVRRGIVALLKRGAVPARPSHEPNIFWVPQECYGDDPDSIADSIVEEWESSRVDPDQDGLWFSLIKNRREGG